MAGKSFRGLSFRSAVRPGSCPVCRRKSSNQRNSRLRQGTYFFRQPVGRGWALVGDAGHHKDFHVGDGITEALRQARSITKAISAGGDAPLVHWWHERDIQALPLFRLGEELGAATPSRTLARHVFKRLAKAGDGAARFLDVFDRRLVAYDAVPFSTVLRSTVDALLAGQFTAFSDFLAQGRKQAVQRKELANRKKLAMNDAPIICAQSAAAESANG